MWKSLRRMHYAKVLPNREELSTATSLTLKQSEEKNNYGRSANTPLDLKYGYKEEISLPCDVSISIEYTNLLYFMICIFPIALQEGFISDMSVRTR